MLPQDVFDVAPDVLRHRLVLSYEALADGVAADQVLAKVLSTIPAPRIAPSQDPTAPAPVTVVAPAPRLGHDGLPAPTAVPAGVATAPGAWTDSPGWVPPATSVPNGAPPAAPWAPPASAPGFPQAPDGAPGGPPA